MVVIFKRLSDFRKLDSKAIYGAMKELQPNVYRFRYNIVMWQTDRQTNRHADILQQRSMHYM